VRNLLQLKAYGDYFDRYSSVLEGEVDSKTAELVQSERLYRETFDAAPVGIVHIGPDGRWLRVNQRLCDLLGFLPHELPEAAPMDAAPAESFRRMAAGELDRYVVDETTFRRKDGSDMWARVNMSIHRDTEGKFQHTIAVIEDITERRLLEAQLRQTNKMDAIGQLASGVAHDFNNLLTVITGFAELISMDAQTVSRHGNELVEITKAAQRAMDLTRQLLAFSRKQVLDAQPLDVNALITEMTGMLGRLIGENVKIALVLDPNLAIAYADRGQVGQVVMNLVVNARDACRAEAR
jgi:PAS domain S-box-containing protein